MEVNPAVSVLQKLTAEVKAGNPVSVHNLTLVPLFGAVADLAIEPLEKALDAGTATVTEIDESGEVGTLRVQNAGKHALLLFDGEELVGAKQNRIVNTTILVPGLGDVEIPVSCVEQGRWDYRSKRFAAGAMLPSSMRRSKAGRVTDNLRSYGELDACQGEVWEEVAEYAERRKVESCTSALADVVEADRGEIADYVAAAPCQKGQTGLAAYIDGRIVGIDLLASDEAYAAIHARLVGSLAAEAIDCPPRPPRKRRIRPATAFKNVLGGDATTSKPPGQGTDVRVTTSTYVATALIHDEQAVHLAVFPAK